MMMLIVHTLHNKTFPGEGFIGNIFNALKNRVMDLFAASSNYSTRVRRNESYIAAQMFGS
ncbi:hypothetical protein BH10BAC2_BH10BAC2_05190 [soil metagenome]